MGLLKYKILILIPSTLSGIYIWPRILINLGIWDWFYYSRIIFLLYWVFIFLIGLHGVKNSTLRYKVLNIGVLTSFLVEGIGFNSSIGGANTMLCMIPPPSTYNGFRIAVAFSFIGSLMIIIYIIFEEFDQIYTKMRDNKKSRSISQSKKKRVDSYRESTSNLSYISVNFMFFHLSFFCPYIIRSVGCNGIPEFFIVPIGIFWFIQGIINVSYQIFSKLIQTKK
ncbi:MAG: hypothetical protein ACXABO_21725 [Promethearchaeota archaeon]